VTNKRVGEQHDGAMWLLNHCCTTTLLAFHSCCCSSAGRGSLPPQLAPESRAVLYSNESLADELVSAHLLSGIALGSKTLQATLPEGLVNAPQRARNWMFNGTGGFRVDHATNQNHEHQESSRDTDDT